ncbi:MAG: lipopolysaccharide transport periplasmic protein LptA [Candidatus Alcyoniella australis]|nr:lipopolysaccharide transport periplasmic protein LptA [Candidatus Alcyoniella australis]
MLLALGLLCPVATWGQQPTPTPPETPEVPPELPQPTGVAQTDEPYFDYLDPQTPINIVSDKLEADNKSRIVKFIGNVVAVKGDAVMRSDMLIVRYAAQGGDLEKVVAVGRVVMVQTDRRVLCEQATYTQADGKLLLEGNPQVWQGTDFIRGRTITFWSGSERVQVQGSSTERVTTVITPGSSGPLFNDGADQPSQPGEAQGDQQ